MDAASNSDMIARMKGLLADEEGDYNEALIEAQETGERPDLDYREIMVPIGWVKTCIEAVEVMDSFPEANRLWRAQCIEQSKLADHWEAQYRLAKSNVEAQWRNTSAFMRERDEARAELAALRLIYLDNAEAEARRRHDHEAVLRVGEGEG